MALELRNNESVPIMTAFKAWLFDVSTSCLLH